MDGIVQVFHEMQVILNTDDDERKQQVILQIK